MRWWADPAASRRMLDLVDDSDIEQGVATSVLGYHALVSGALLPLAKETLVDAGLVAAAANEVDLTPVAKALGRATQPVLGAASTRYGELLANSIHTQAVDDTTRLIVSLSAAGLPVPLAVDRAIAVHGVPSKSAGKYAFHMKAPVVAEVVKADLADRALMLWARDVSRRERGASPESFSKRPSGTYDRAV